MAAGSALPFDRVFAEEHSWDYLSPSASALPGATGERIAASPGSYYRVYRAVLSTAAEPTTPAWVQIDLGSSQPIEAIKLFPTNGLYCPGDGFPLRFSLQVADSPDCQDAQIAADWTHSDYPAPGDHIIAFAAPQLRGRYVRLTLSRLRPRRDPTFYRAQPADKQAAIRRELDGTYLFALAKIAVISGGRDIAERQRVTVSASLGNAADVSQLTRPARPQGEGIRTDFPANVTDAATWKPVPNAAESPTGGLRLQDGLFLTAWENNRRYLMEFWGLEDLLLEFRKRNGQLPSPAAAARQSGWEKDQPGSLAARFLMGAANGLKWREDAEMRARVNAVVAGIAETRQADGYIMAFPESEFFAAEHGGYTRSWTTLGLIAAGSLGNSQAFSLLRGYYDGFNRRDYLPEVLRGCVQGGQAMVADSQMYFTPVGKPEDLQTLQRYFQENYWLNELAAKKPEAIWQYPYDRPHCYLLTQLEAYLDLYRATGDRRYWAAVEGGWEMYRREWKNVGGSISIIELVATPPGSNSLYDKLGEMCGSSFWILLNHRLHLLHPNDERYMGEIEQSIYNVVLANQDGGEGIRYHTVLVGQKEKATRVNTCCEGQGTRLLGCLPQFIYSTAPDGVFVNLFEPSAFACDVGGHRLELNLETRFPHHPAVALTVHAAEPTSAKLRIRVPGWATGPMAIALNGANVGQGTPGSYFLMDRIWKAGDKITFTLPIALRQTRYRGVDQVAQLNRFAFEYGPILLAALDVADTEIELAGATSAMTAVEWIRPDGDHPLHFLLPKNIFGEGSEVRLVPYYAVKDEFFSCAPIVRTKASALET